MSDDIRDRYRERLEETSSEVEPSEEMVEANEIIEGSLAHELATLLSDSISFYFRAQGAHWNVIGSNFSEWHDFFGMIAGDVYESLDALAENIRKLGHLAPCRLSAYMSMRELDDGVMHTDGMMLARDLLDANEVILGCIRDAGRAAEMNQDYAVMDFLAKREDAHKTWAWQLRAHLGVA